MTRKKYLIFEYPKEPLNFTKALRTKHYLLKICKPLTIRRDPSRSHFWDADKHGGGGEGLCHKCCPSPHSKDAENSDDLGPKRSIARRRSIPPFPSANPSLPHNLQPLRTCSRNNHIIKFNVNPTTVVDPFGTQMFLGRGESNVLIHPRDRGRPGGVGREEACVTFPSYLFFFWGGVGDSHLPQH
ncbi:hypothetical protein CEXT_742401 [Caerostris extrusa]|uniref:Uncharacterized protein n=1 Tax=Caerostris extrusa TaxID=172846 RepID=A0AAV4Y321_CAEEX|nr:hypothetical protein CEXT_742401 [Caerostris extrusa]